MAHQKPLIREPETRPIRQEQIVAEVKTIYSGLVMVENKCIEVNKLQTEIGEERSDLTRVQWQALLTLHRTLLHEHHDFFLASQHPSANTALKRLTAMYKMPARMWRHGIHSFLELLRHNLPQSRDYMATFIYLAYSMMAHLDETQILYETWTESLGHLGRHRMAIEDEDIRDREIWTCTLRRWYAKHSNISPTTSRLHHHLAILAQPNTLQQLSCFSKPLYVVNSFPSAQESILTLFDPILERAGGESLSVDSAFARVHGVLFTSKATEDELSTHQSELLGRLDDHIGRTGRRWLESGYFTGISMACSLLGLGEENNVLMRAISQHPGDSALTEESLVGNLPKDSLDFAMFFAVESWSNVIRRWGDVDTLMHHHTILNSLLHMARFPRNMVHIENRFPWKLISTILNYLLGTTGYDPYFENRENEDAYAAPKDESHRPLPNCYSLRGSIYPEEHSPQSMFPDEDAKCLDMISVWNTKHSKHFPTPRISFSETDSGYMKDRPGPLPIRPSISEGLHPCHKRRKSIRGRDHAKAAVVKELSSGCQLKHVKCFLSGTWISSILSALSTVSLLSRA